VATVARRKAITIDQLRKRLELVMATTTERHVPCSHCGGKGELVSKRPMTNMDVERATGISNGTLSNLRSRKSQSGMYFETGMKLLAWIEEQERAIDRVDDVDDDPGPVSPSAREASRDRLGKMRSAVSAAAAQASIDNINRPMASQPLPADRPVGPSAESHA
jgi:hypothetical protein